MCFYCQVEFVSVKSEEVSNGSRRILAADNVDVDNGDSERSLWVLCPLGVGYTNKERNTCIVWASLAREELGRAAAAYERGSRNRREVRK